MQRFSVDFFLSHGQSNSTFRKGEVFFQEQLRNRFRKRNKIPEYPGKRGTNLKKMGTNLEIRPYRQMVLH